jgi:hypothetical protein
VINPPRLTKLDKGAIEKYHAKYERYLEIFANNEALISMIMPPTPLKACIDRRLLSNLCPFEFDNRAPTDVTDDMIEKWIEKRVGIPQKSVLHVVDSQVKKQLKMNLSIQDTDSRVLELFISHKEIVEKLGWKYYFTKLAKTAVNQIVAVLMPEGFKTRMEQDLKDEFKHLQEDYFKFAKYCGEEGVRCERYYPLEPKLKSVSFDLEPLTSESTPSFGRGKKAEDSTKQNCANESRAASKGATYWDA